MIHYHGTPVTPIDAAITVLSKRHAMVSFAHPDQISLVAEVCQSFVLDCGAYSFWKLEQGSVDIDSYAKWINLWGRHPGCDWVIIPDKIDASGEENDDLIKRWNDLGIRVCAVPVWHLHESTKRLVRLIHEFSRIAIGSSGGFSRVGTPLWWDRISDAMEIICDGDGVAKTKIHGLRMLDPTIYSHLPLSSADSTNIARNIKIDKKWHAYATSSKSVRAIVLADRIEHHASASRWMRTRGIHKNFDLLG